MLSFLPLPCVAASLRGACRATAGLVETHYSDAAWALDGCPTPSGRAVSFGPAVETNFRDVRPGQPADSAYLPGAKVMGRDVSRTRTVTENGVLVRQDVFRSHYNPVWGGPATPQ